MTTQPLVTCTSAQPLADALRKLLGGAPSLAALSLGLGLASLAGVIVARARFLRSIRSIPGPPYDFLTGALATIRGGGPGSDAPSFFTQRHLVLRELHKVYGPVVKIVMPLGRGSIITYAKAADVAAAFKDVKSFPTRPSLASALPNGLLALPTAAKWRAHRAALLPALSTKAMRGYFPAIIKDADAMCDLLARTDGKDTEVHKPLTAATFCVIHTIGFGVEIGSLEEVMKSPLMELGSSLLGGQVAMMATPTHLVTLLRKLPTSLMPESQRRMLEAKHVYSNQAKSLFDSASSEIKPGAELVARDDARSLLEALAHSGMPFAEACDEIITLLIAGHETTANTLSWAMNLLAHHPEAQTRAREEVEAVCKGRPLEFEDLPKLVFVKDVFFEALRIHPTVPMVMRACAADAIVGGYRVPAGAALGYSVCVAARDPAVFKDPEVFDPARHGEGADGSAWSPFGPAGPRKCMGYRLADIEAVAFLAVVLLRFDLQPPSPLAPKPVEYTDATLGPKESGLFLRCVPRKLSGL